MDKQYGSVVRGLRITAVVVMAVAFVMALLVLLSNQIGNLTNALLIFLVGLVLMVLLNATAAGLDLLAGIEVNTRARQERRRPDKIEKLG